MLLSIGLLFLLLNLQFLTPISAQSEVTIAALVPVTGDWPVGKTILGALSEATDDINKNDTLLPNHTITFQWKDTGCHDGKGLGDAIEFRRDLAEDFTVIIGDGCDSVCETVGLLASHWQIPMITWGCGSVLLTDMDYYDTLARVVGPYPRTVKILDKLFEEYKWKRVSTVYTFLSFRIINSVYIIISCLFHCLCFIPFSFSSVTFHLCSI